MSDLGQRVVLGAQADHQVAAAERRGEGGREVGDAGADLEAACREDLDDLRDAAVLLEGEFRLGVDRVGERDELGPRRLDRLRHLRPHAGQSLTREAFTPRT